jgi:hypothetical protein
MLNRIGESGYPCLIPDFRWNGFSFSPLSMMLTTGLSYIAFIMLITFLLVIVFWGILSCKCVESYWRIFLCLLRLSCTFCLCFHYCAVLQLMICIGWAIPASLRWSRLSHGFILPLFYWGFSHQCLLKKIGLYFSFLDVSFLVMWWE